MIFREAKLSDINEITSVRFSVRENVLNTPGLVTADDYKKYLTVDGKGWVCETAEAIAGFAVIGLVQHHIWALFVRPEQEHKGIGKKLHNIMLDWYFSQTKEKVWLATAPDTRAEMFYTKSGWSAVGMVNKGEVKFEMTFDDWNTIRLKD